MSKLNELKNNKAFVNICHNLMDYNWREFDRGYDTIEELLEGEEDILQLIAYTTLADKEECEIQVTLDLHNNLIKREVTGLTDYTHVEVEKYESWEDIAYVTEYMCFDEIVSLKIDVQELLPRLA